MSCIFNNFESVTTGISFTFTKSHYKTPRNIYANIRRLTWKLLHFLQLFLSNYNSTYLFNEHIFFVSNLISRISLSRISYISCRVFTDVWSTQPSSKLESNCKQYLVTFSPNNVSRNFFSASFIYHSQLSIYIRIYRFLVFFKYFSSNLMFVLLVILLLS